MLTHIQLSFNPDLQISSCGAAVQPFVPCFVHTSRVTQPQTENQHSFFSYHWQLSSFLVFPRVLRPLCPQETSVFLQLQCWACSDSADSAVGHGVTVAPAGNVLSPKCALTFPHPRGWGGESGGKQKTKLTSCDEKSLIIENNKLMNYY